MVRKPGKPQGQDYQNRKEGGMKQYACYDIAPGPVPQ